MEAIITYLIYILGIIAIISIIALALTKSHQLDLRVSLFKELIKSTDYKITHDDIKKYL